MDTGWIGSSKSLVVRKCMYFFVCFLIYFLYVFISSKIDLSSLHDVFLVLRGLADNLSVAGFNGLDENSLLGVNL